MSNGLNSWNWVHYLSRGFDVSSEKRLWKDFLRISTSFTTEIWNTLEKLFVFSEYRHK
jgi:hypothetical protein